MTKRWIRKDAGVVLEHGNALTLIGADDVVRQFEGASAELVRIVLESLSAPQSERELADRVRVQAGACESDVLAEILSVLGAAKVIGSASDDGPPAIRPCRGRIVLGVTGAIAAVDVPALARIFLARGFEVAVAMTPSARKMVSAHSLAAITHRRVHTSFWQSEPGAPAPHIQLSTWADLIVVYPATAATLSRIATGDTGELVSATVVASQGPVILAPSMNEAMYRSPSVQRNLEQLRQDGHHLVHPRFGHEVATTPAARTAIYGVAPGPSELVRAVELVWATTVAASRGADRGDAWDRQYAAIPLERLAWYTTELDADLAAALTTLASASPRVRLLDVGTGPGTAAIFAAQRGFEVVATDVSIAALALAKRRAAGLPIAWVVDDFAASRLWGQFAVIVDRGCLHCLPRERWPRYAENAGRLLVAGGSLLLKQHAPEEGGRHGTHPPQPGELEALFGAHFAISSVTPSILAGTLDPPPQAVLIQLTRK